MKYQDFHLRIRGGSNGLYPTEANARDGASEDGSLSLTLTASEIVQIGGLVSPATINPDFLTDFGITIADKLPKLMLKKGVSYRRVLEEYGGLLHDRLFDRQIGDLFERNFGKIENDPDAGLRIRLTTDSPEICALPWELLYDPDRRRFLATSSQTQLTRYAKLPIPIRKLRIEPPVNVLVLIPEASGLDVESERTIILDAFSELRRENAVVVDIVDKGVTRGTISKALVEKRYHILHFIGHGSFSGELGYLLINPDTASPDADCRRGLLPADVLAEFMREHPSMKLVVLNSCKGAKTSSLAPFAGVAQQLVTNGVPAVVAMQFSIADQAALLFAREFYLKLCKGWSPGRVDTAISHARSRLHQDFRDALPLSFAAPVIYLRSSTGVIFDLRTKKALLDPPELISQRFAVRNTYQENIPLLESLKATTPPEAVAELEQEITENKKRLEVIRSEIRNWYRNVAVIGCAALLAIVAAWVGLFSYLDYFVEKRFIALCAPLIDKARLHPDIRILLIDKDHNGSLGAFDSENPEKWRLYHMELVRLLAEKAKAKMVVFDLFFERESEPPDLDREFAKAITSAEALGTRVIVGADLGEGLDRYPPQFPSQLNQVLQSRWGDVNVGLLPGLGDPPQRGFLVGCQLAKKVEKASPDRFDNLAPSLALRAIVELNDPRAAASFSERDRLIRLSGNTSNTSVGPIPVDYDLKFAIELLAPEEFANARSPYNVIVERGRSGQSLGYPEGTIVLIGTKTDTDDDQRFGVEYQANVISNILQNAYIYPMRRTWLSHFIVLLMVLIGFLLRTRFKKVADYGFSISIDKIIKFDRKIPIILIIVPVIYLFAAFLAYRHARLLFDMNYHIFAFVLAYSGMGWLQRRLKLGKA